MAQRGFTSRPLVRTHFASILAIEVQRHWWHPYLLSVLFGWSTVFVLLRLTTHLIIEHWYQLRYEICDILFLIGLPNYDVKKRPLWCIRERRKWTRTSWPSRYRGRNLPMREDSLRGGSECDYYCWVRMCACDAWATASHRNVLDNQCVWLALGTRYSCADYISRLKEKGYT